MNYFNDLGRSKEAKFFGNLQCDYIATLQTKKVSKLHSLFGRKHGAFLKGVPLLDMLMLRNEALLLRFFLFHCLFFSSVTLFRRIPYPFSVYINFFHKNRFVGSTE